MTREEKIDELYNFCNMHDSCDQCELDDLASVCEFEDMCNKKIDRFYNLVNGHFVHGLLSANKSSLSFTIVGYLQ